MKSNIFLSGMVCASFLLCSSFVFAQKEKVDATEATDQEALQEARAPNFSLPGIAEEVELLKHRGSIVYVDFWASWCTPCKKSFPWMNAMQARYGEQGLKIIAINLDESRKDAKSFLEENPAQFSIAFDPKGSTAELYEVQGMPSSYLIGPNGEVAYRHLGFRPTDKRMLEAAIEHLVSSL